MNIIFLDIDGPLIPWRMYHRGDRPFNHQLGSFIYDPIAVDAINYMCEKMKCQIVFSTSHNENPQHVMKHQATCNNLVHNLHEDCTTKFPTTCNTRLEGIKEWLLRHPEVVQWIVIDDMDVGTNRQVKVEYTDGLLRDHVKKAFELFGHELDTQEFISYR